MISKGFILYKNGKIPFVIRDYRMELFSDNSLINEYCKEYNFKNNYILHGQCFDDGFNGRKATFLVEFSMGNILNLGCYIVNMFDKDEEYDSIGLQSPSLDEIFRYDYERIDRVRKGANLDLEQITIYKILFGMNHRTYEMQYRIGYNNRMGLLEDLNRKGEIIVPIYSDEIQECFYIATIFHRLSIFILSTNDVSYKKITLYNKGHKVGWFYCPLISENDYYSSKGFFYEFDVMKYIPRILNNIALDSGNKITKSVPLGHLMNSKYLFAPQRFMSQMVSFEYLFDKLNHNAAQGKNIILQKELEQMFDLFPQLLSKSKFNSDSISKEIKELRRRINHGYEYYYDFIDKSHEKYLMILLDRLLKCMSLYFVGFPKEDIENYCVY